MRFYRLTFFVSLFLVLFSCVQEPSYVDVINGKYFYDTNKGIYFALRDFEGEINISDRTRSIPFILEAGTKEKRFNKEKIESLREEYGYLFSRSDEKIKDWVEANFDDCSWFFHYNRHDDLPKDRLFYLDRYIHLYIDEGKKCFVPDDERSKYVGLLTEKKDGEFGTFYISKVFKSWGSDPIINNNYTIIKEGHNLSNWDDYPVLMDYEEFNKNTNFSDGRLYEMCYKQDFVDKHVVQFEEHDEIDDLYGSITFTSVGNVFVDSGEVLNLESYKLKLAEVPKGTSFNDWEFIGWFINDEKVTEIVVTDNIKLYGKIKYIGD